MDTLKRSTYVVAAIAIVFFAWFGSIDATANSQVDTGLKRALTTFATARTLNAVISVAQGTEVSVQPMGMGINFTPGQILNPIHELIEQFSNVMLLASIAFGIQKILILIGSHWVISGALTILIVIALVFQFRESKTSFNWMSRCLFVLLLLRFAVPVSLIGTELLFDNFMKSKYELSQNSISATSTQLNNLVIQPKTPLANPGFFDKIKELTPDLDISGKVQKFKAAIEEATEHVITLITVFLMQTLLLPLLLLWCLFAITKVLLSPRMASYEKLKFDSHLPFRSL